MILKKRLFVIGVLALLIFSAHAFGQSSSITGVVTDPSDGVLQSAKVTVKNTATGVAQEQVTNNTGQYTASALQVGTYAVTAEKEGFATQTKSDVRLGAAAQLKVDFKLELGQRKTEIVEVNIATENLILESGSSIGVVLPEDKINQLPLVNSNVLDLVKVMGGVVMATDPIFSAEATTLAGLSATYVNIQKDGVTASEVRWGTGLNTPVNLNPESIGEFKVIITPVDAEMGRGSGQVQVVTRSGSNTYHGSGVWNIQNSALDSNQWIYNKQKTKPDWRNQNELTFNVNGPLIKNKTFFFVLYDQQWAMLKTNNLNIVLPTNCAKKGIFRYFDGYMSGNFQQTDPTQIGSANRESSPLTIRTVEADGAPRIGQLTQPAYMGPNAGAVSKLHAYSVFGPFIGAGASWNPETDPNCKQVPLVTDKSNLQGYNQIDPAWVNYLSSGSAWDTYRDRDATGYVGKFLDLVPSPNNFDTGDGLNTAGYRWTRRNIGVDNIYGLGEAPQRKQINFRVDHNFNSRHRASVSYIYERDTGEDAMPSLPKNSYGGALDRTPQTLSASLTSTLKPMLLNEFRVGFTRTNSWTNGPLKAKNSAKLTSLLNELFPTTNFPKYQSSEFLKDQPILVGITGFEFGTGYSKGYINFNPYGNGQGNMGTDWGSIDPRWAYSDTITLTVGRHSFRIGGETQRTKSDQKMDGEVSFYGAVAMVHPVVSGGYTGPPNQILYNNLMPPGDSRYALPGMVGNTSTGTAMGIQTLMNTMSGSLGSIKQFYFINHPDATSYNDIRSGELYRTTLFRQNQINFFAQDNWRVTDDLTLNLGMRYEWYGVPYLGNGMTAGFKGGALNAFGLSGRNWSNWMNLKWKPGDPIANAYKNCDAANSEADGTCKPTTLAFIGPDSPNPNQQIYSNDYNNFGPVFGFAYTLPWGGKGKTVLRGGIQVNYMTLGRATINSMPGLSYSYTYIGNNAYMDLSNVSSLVPLELPTNIVPPIANPTTAVTDRSVSPTVYDANLRSPYTQSLNLILSRTIGSSLTLDVRYAGNLSRKQVSSINLNVPNYFNNGLFDAFVAARRGENPALLDKLLWGTNIAGYPAWGYGPVGTTVNGVYQSGAHHLRKSSSTMGALANGDFASLAGTLAMMNLTPAYNTDPNISKYIINGQNGQVLRAAGMPENFIYANPQFKAVNFNGNFNHNNYHSMQAQVTLRPTHGLGFSATYTWSRQLGSLGYTDYGNRAADYGLTGGRSHALTSYGTFDLPFGPNRWLFSGVSPNILGRIIGGWQLSWIHTMQTGAPMSITARSGLWGDAQPDRVGPFNTKSGYVTWKPNATTGNYFNWEYRYVTDPQCNDPRIVDPTLKTASACTLYALADQSGKTIFQNSTPGVRGNFDRNSLTAPGVWNTDMAFSKSIPISEGKSFSLRVDATNVFNHTQPAFRVGVYPGSRGGSQLPPATYLIAPYAPYYDFGQLDSKIGCRTFQARIRFDF
jgi:hypothetical protein